MKIITENKYKEYLALKRWAKKEKVFQSLNSIVNLEDDIDLPIKRSVAMCALLGLEPLFSCCGFDYKNQPYHKSHQYGESYIIFKENPKTLSMLYYPLNWNFGWKYTKHIKGFLKLVLKIDTTTGNPHWRKRECIHFSEELVLGINWLERFLLFQQDYFLDSIVVEDTNQNYNKSGIRFWQYKPKNSWTVKKELLNTY